MGFVGKTKIGIAAPVEAAHLLTRAAAHLVREVGPCWFPLLMIGRSNQKKEKGARTLSKHVDNMPNFVQAILAKDAARCT